MTKCFDAPRRWINISKSAWLVIVCHCLLAVFLLSWLVLIASTTAFWADSAALKLPLLDGWNGWLSDAISLLNSSSVKIARFSSMLKLGSVGSRKVSQSGTISRSVIIVASFLSKAMLSVLCKKVCCCLPFNWSTLARILSMLSYCSSSFCAVFAPMPATPLIPSDASPMRVR